MARKFKCSKCNEDIIVKHLWPGEDANCRACGKVNTVPEDFENVPDLEYDKYLELKTPVLEQEDNQATKNLVNQVIVKDISMTFGARSFLWSSGF